ncbi:DNA-directed RNA polymerase I subunit RPA43 [Pelodytes ibericus]
MAEPEKVTETRITDTGSQPVVISCLELPSFSDACKLVKTRYSCLVVETHRRHLALSPKYLQKKRSGIQEQLNTELLKYSTGMEGVPVAYDNIKLVSEFGDIYDDLGHIHVNIEADFVIFRPDYGQTLVGVVNKVAPSHIGCLVHGCFNASVPKPHKMPIEVWQHVEVKIGDNMEFSVFRLDSDAVGVFCIRGNLDSSMEALALQKLNDINANKVVNDSSDQIENVIDITEAVVETNINTQEIPKRKGKKQKVQETLIQETEVDTHNISGDYSVLEDSNVEKASKKKREKKRKNATLHDGVLAEGDTSQYSDTSMLELDQVKQTKKSKKPKHQANTEINAECSFQNGVIESSFTESSALEDLSYISEHLQEKPKKKHKRKHRDSLLPTESKQGISNGTASAVHHDESIVEIPEVTQEVPKKHKHKKKRRGHSLLDNNDFQDVSLTESEPKAKKRRKE